MTEVEYQRCVALLRQIEENRKTNKSTFYDPAQETLRWLIEAEDEKRKARQESDTWRAFATEQNNLS